MKISFSKAEEEAAQEMMDLFHSKTEESGAKKIVNRTQSNTGINLVSFLEETEESFHKQEDKIHQVLLQKK